MSPPGDSHSEVLMSLFPSPSWDQHRKASSTVPSTVDKDTPTGFSSCAALRNAVSPVRTPGPQCISVAKTHTEVQSEAALTPYAPNVHFI